MRVMQYKKWVICLSAAVALTLSACSTTGKSSSSATNKEGNAQVLKVGINSELSTADVSLAMDNTTVDVMSQLAEGLYSLDKEGKAVPALATALTEPTNDGKTYTFKLRQGAKWSNGDEITADDFVYSWQRTVDPKTASPQAYYFEGIKNYADIAAGKKKATELGVKALDDHTLEVQLIYPMSYFQQLLAVPAYFPLNQKYVEKVGDKYGTNSDNTLYNGPFVMEGWNGSSSTWKYKKNDQYWDKDKVKLKTIDAQVIKEVATGKNLFDAGDIDYVKISGETVAQEKGNKELHIRQIPGTQYLEFNNENEILKNRDARKAIDLSIDSESLAKNVLNDGTEKAQGYVPAGFINPETNEDFTKEIGDINPTDKKQAKELWEKAKKELAIDSASLSILCSDTDSAKKVAEYVQGAISENLDGLKIDVSPVPFNNRIDNAKKGDYDMVLSGWTPVYADPIDFLNLKTTHNGNNDANYSNQEYDKLVEDANNSSDVQKRWKLMQEADQIIAKDAPVAPLYQITEAYMVSSQLKGIEFGPLGTTYFKEVSIK